MKGIGVLYHAFRHYLRDKRKRIAPLQVISRLEEHLTKEFCYVILAESNADLLPMTSLGRKTDGRRIDIALLEGDLSKVRDKVTEMYARKKLVIRALVEVKYLRNRHRISYADAQDEIGSTLQDLCKQLRKFDPATYDGYQVALRGKRKDVYGVVIASYVRRANDPDESAVFRSTVYERAKKQRLRYEDLRNPQLDDVYVDEPVTVLNAEFRVSLYAGLWRRDDVR